MAEEEKKEVKTPVEKPVETKEEAPAETAEAEPEAQEGEALVPEEGIPAEETSKNK